MKHEESDSDRGSGFVEQTFDNGSSATLYTINRLIYNIRNAKHY